MEDKILNSIKEAEHKAKAIIAEAYKKQEKILVDAKEKAAGLIKAAQQDETASSQNNFKGKSADIGEQKKKIIAEGSKKLSQLEKSTASGRAKASELIVKKMEEEIENA